MKLDFIDVRRAYFYAEAARYIYIELPKEDHEEGKGRKVEKINVWYERCSNKLPA